MAVQYNSRALLMHLNRMDAEPSLILNNYVSARLVVFEDKMLHR
jgi:hypothetical protein